MNDVFVHNNIHNDTPKPPPPIFVRGLIDYTEVCTKLVDLVGVDNFFCKSSADRLRIQTANPDSYRTLVRYLKEENAEFHTYLLKEDKPICVVIRNLHPTTQTELIKEELEVRLFENQPRSQVKYFNFLRYYIPKLKLKSHTSQNRSVSAIIVRNMVTPKLIVSTPRAVFGVGLIISPPHVQIHAMFHQNAHFALAIILPATRDAQYHNLNCYTENLLELNSDHSSILLTISASPLTRLESPKLFKPSTDKNQFHDLVNQQIKLNVKLKSTSDIDLAVNNFTNLIQSAAWSSTSKSQTTFHNPLLPEYIHCIIVEKRRARANFQRTRIPSHKHEYNKLTNHLKKVLEKHKSETFNNFLSKLSPKDGSLWRATKNICKFKTSNLPIKNQDGSYVISNSDRSEIFKVHLSGIFQPHPDIYSQTNASVVDDFLNSPPYLPSNPIKHFTPNDIKFVINIYSLKKSPGFDLITAEVARCLPKKAFIHLSHIFNSINVVFTRHTGETYSMKTYLFPFVSLGKCVTLHCHSGVFAQLVVLKRTVLCGDGYSVK
ncbi:hypothetical protein QTP88_019721 [Uroleucon formosanum]